MKRALFTQIRNEWTDNLWLIIGLSIVSLAIWVFSLLLWNLVRPSFETLGFDADDVWVATINKQRADFDIYDMEHLEENINNYNEKCSEDLRGLLRVIRNSPNVEAAALARNGMPYKMSGWWTGFWLDDPTADSTSYNGNQRWVSPDMIRVLKIESLTGKSSEELEAMLRRGEVLVSPLLSRKYLRDTETRDAEELLGKVVYPSGAEDLKYRVADMVPIMKRGDYDMTYGGQVLIGLDENARLSDIWDIAIRVKPGRGAAFKEEFNSTPDMQRQRNVMLSNLTTLEARGDAINRESRVQARLYTFVIIFLMVVIFLGFLGIFWFRVQQRVSEIAIRKVCGAKMGDIFRRILGEGLILLTIATVLCGIIGWLIVRSTDLADGMETDSIILMECATYVIVAIGISLSLAYPAWRAMHMEPAIAIKAE
jgi:putative ABC transport system permease protein